MLLLLVCRFAVVCTVGTFAAGLQEDLQQSSYHLVLGNGGYARLLNTPPSLTDLTLSAWVNITSFPNGVAPILTTVAPDAKSQVAFFLRHDGLGVLWGGPPQITQHRMDQVDRHPRTQWVPIDDNLRQRKRRDAVDYSEGLGDIVDILADSRRGRAYDTWTPYGFTDVDQMGVADLEALPSGLSGDLHLLPTRGGFSRSESYNDWTIVPYELTMQESDPYDQHLAEPEPRIITEPSGDDDFVFFNWNVPAAPQKSSIPQSPNEWSPIWQPKKTPENKSDLPERNEEQSVTEKFQLQNNNRNYSGAWSSQVTEVKLTPDRWSPYNIKETIYINPHSEKRTSPSTTTTTTTTPRPTTKRTTVRPQLGTRRITSRPRFPWLTSRKTTSRPQPYRPTIPQPQTINTTPRSIPAINQRARTTTRLPIVRTSTSTSSPYLQRHHMRYTTRRFTAPPTTKTPRLSSRPPAALHSPAPSRHTTRMPLWKLIKQPHKNPQTSTPQTPITTTTTTTPATSIPSSSTRIPSTLSARKTTNTPSIPVTKATNRTPTQVTTRQLITTRRPKPVPTEHFPSSEETTEKPQITGQKSKVSIWSSTVDIHKPRKSQTYPEKWSAKPQASTNIANKHKPVSITPYHVDEFQRAMEVVPLVKDGNKAIVYSIPIFDEDAFNIMYKHYQEQETPSSSAVPDYTAQTYNAPTNKQEEEINENQLGETNLPDSVLINHSADDAFRETVAPAILTEEEAVLIPTEETLPSTPPRSDIPIEEEALDNLSLQETLPEENDPNLISILPKPVKTQETALLGDKKELSASQTVNTEESQNTEEILYPQTEMKTTSAPNILLNDNQEMNSHLQFSGKDEAAAPTIIPLNDDLLPLKVHEIPVSLQSSTTTNIPTKLESLPKAPITSSEEVPKVNDEDEPELSSASFAVFHIDEDDIPYYTEPQETTAEDIFSIDRLYQPAGVLIQEEDINPVSHYQESSALFHEQLPPQYAESEPAPRPIAYSDSIQTLVHFQPNDTDSIMFSSNPEELIKQGFLPHPVHYVSSQEEAEIWMKEQKSSQTPAEDRVFVADSTDTSNSLPSDSDYIPDEDNGGIHFKKLPYDFAANQWYHIAFTWSREDHQVGVYINGDLIGTLTDILTGQEALTGGGLTILGQTLLPDLTDFDHTSHFVGEISDVNLWSRRLEPQTLHAIYQCTAHESTSPILAWNQMSMRFYSDIYIKESGKVCGK